MSSIQKIEQLVSNRSLFITGGASGLGLGIALRFARNGWRVGIFDKNTEHVGAATFMFEKENLNVEVFRGDVTQYLEIKQCIDGFSKEGLGVMINNAGIAAGGDFLGQSISDWERVYRVNVFGVANGCKAALPHLTGNRAILHNVASAAGFMSAPMMASYNSSKAAVVSLTETLIGEYYLNKSLNISVSLPAFFQTNLLDSLLANDSEREVARLLMKHSGYSVEQAVDDILEGISKQQNYVFAPKRLKSLWRFKRFLPDTFLKVLPKKRNERIEVLKKLEEND